jgi:hypothetical protein
MPTRSHSSSTNRHRQHPLKGRRQPRLAADRRQRTTRGARQKGSASPTTRPRAVAAPTSSSASSSETGTPRCRRSSPITSSKRSVTA